MWEFDRTALFMTFTKFIISFKSYKIIVAFFSLNSNILASCEKKNKKASCVKNLNIHAFTQKQKTNLLWTFPFSSCDTLL